MKEILDKNKFENFFVTEFPPELINFKNFLLKSV
jgi:hypothetical protein